MKNSLLLGLFFFFISSFLVAGKDIIVIKNPKQPKSEKRAILVLNGLGTSKKGMKHQKRFFEQQDFDVYIPDYICKKSYDLTKANAISFFENHSLKEYKELYVFSYIIGAWTINEYINEVGEMNIKRIVYDRSPIQERAPRVVDDKIPLIGRLVAGKLLREFKNMPYPAIKKKNIEIGLIVESKATSLMRKFEEYTLSLGSFNWKNLNLNQVHDDLMYTRLNHDEMYVSFHEIGAEILCFIESGNFSNSARRQHFSWDPFLPYRKEKTLK